MLYIANIRLPTEKAHGLQIMKMCEAFARTGVRVELVVPTRSNPMKEDPFAFYDVEPLFKIRKVFSLDLVRFGRIGFLAQSLSFTLRASLYALASRADMLYTRDPLVAYALSMFSRNVVFEVHTKSLSFVTKGALRRARRVIFITHGLEELYVKVYKVPGEKILVEPDATDPRYFETPLDKAALRGRLGISADASVAGYVGGMATMGHDKGVAEIVDAVSRAGGHLLFYGVAGEGKEALERLFEKYRMRERAVIVEDLSQKHMADYMRVCDALLMNYPSAEHYALYMSPLKMFSYMASGVPIVTTDLPSVREVLGDEEAFFVPPENTEVLARAIAAVFRDPAGAQRRARAARQKSARYSWDARAQRIISFCSATFSHS